jgi:hypothetical protein
MCKAVDRGMTITDVKVLEKHGGKSGSFVSPSTYKQQLTARQALTARRRMLFSLSALLP